MRVVYKHDAVAHEDIVLDRHPFADKSVALDAAPLAYQGARLDFYKGADHRIIADRAAVEIGECPHLYARSKDNIWRNSLHQVIHMYIVICFCI